MPYLLRPSRSSPQTWLRPYVYKSNSPCIRSDADRLDAGADLSLLTVRRGSGRENASREPHTCQTGSLETAHNIHGEMRHGIYEKPRVTPQVRVAEHAGWLSGVVRAYPLAELKGASGCVWLRRAGISCFFPRRNHQFLSPGTCYCSFTSNPRFPTRSLRDGSKFTNWREDEMADGFSDLER